METLALCVDCSPIMKVDGCPIYEAMTTHITGICHVRKFVANCDRMPTKCYTVSNFLLFLYTVPPLSLKLESPISTE